MRRSPPLVLVLAAAACGAPPAGDDDSGIRGRALAGPQCPVEVEGSPCPDVPWQGTVVVTDLASDEEFPVATDAEGRFELSVDPGTYEVSIAPGTSPPFAKPQAVTVEEGAFTEIVVSVDTGIR